MFNIKLCVVFSFNIHSMNKLSLYQYIYIWENLYIKKKACLNLKPCIAVLCTLWDMSCTPRVDDYPGFLPSDDIAEREKHRKGSCFHTLLHSVHLRPRFRCITCCLNSGKNSHSDPSHHSLHSMTFHVGRCCPDDVAERIWFGRTYCVKNIRSYNPHGSDSHPHSHYTIYIIT